MFNSVSREEFNLMQDRAIRAEAEVITLTEQSKYLKENLAAEREYVKALRESTLPKIVQPEVLDTSQPGLPSVAEIMATPAYGKTAIILKNAQIAAAREREKEDKLEARNGKLTPEEKEMLAAT